MNIFEEYSRAIFNIKKITEHILNDSSTSASTIQTERFWSAIYNDKESKLYESVFVGETQQMPVAYWAIIVNMKYWQTEPVLSSRWKHATEKNVNQRLHLETLKNTDKSLVQDDLNDTEQQRTNSQEASFDVVNHDDKKIATRQLLHPQYSVLEELNHL